MRIRTKIFLTNLIVTILLIGILTYSLGRYSSRIIYEKTSEDIGFSVSQIAKNTDNILQSYEQMIDLFYTNDDLLDRLSYTYTSDVDALNAYFDYFLTFTKWLKVNKDILRLTIYTDNPTFQFADIKLIDKEFKQSDEYRRSQESNAAMYGEWSYLGVDPYYHVGIFRLFKKITTPNTGENLFVLLDLDEKILSNLIAEENQNRRFIIALPNGQVVIDNFMRNRMPRNIWDYEFYDQLKEFNSRYYDDRERHSEYLITQKRITSRQSRDGIQILSLIPIDELNRKVNDMKKFALKMLIAAIVISITMIYLTSIGLMKRLMLLMKKMNQTDIDNLQEEVHIPGNDEISILGNLFNKMMRRINSLIKETYEAEINRKELEIQNKESQLYALQTQINPHHLFNVLNVIRGNLLEQGDKKNAGIIQLLADSFRNTLSTSGHLIPLNEELRIVETYLKIQAFRFGDRLQYQLDIPEQVRQLPIPRLALQTVVENVIIHVLDQQKSVTTVHIQVIASSPDVYTIRIADNGQGISEDLLASIMNEIVDESQTTDGSHIGLRNTYQRLRSLGSTGGLTIESKLGIGTVVTLHIQTLQ